MEPLCAFDTDCRVERPLASCDREGGRDRMSLTRRADSRSMNDFFRSLAFLEPTYNEIGATLSGGLPPGYRHDHYEIDLGTGDGVFKRSVIGLRTWQAHRTRRTRVFPECQRLAAGESMLVVLELPFLAIVAPCRIIQVVDDDDQFGFAYGTLPGHPERGEESFVVRASPDGLNKFEVTAFSSPASPVVQLSGPIARSVQATTTKRFLIALKEFVQR